MHAPALASRVHSQPNVTPMIDVMLVLLIIFMVVTPLLDDGFRSAPPTGANLTKHLEEQGEVVIGIDDQGQLYLNRQPTTLALMQRALEARVRTTPQNRVVYLRADRNTEYRSIQETLDAAQRSGARVVGLVAEATRTPLP